MNAALIAVLVIVGVLLISLSAYFLMRNPTSTPPPLKIIPVTTMAVPATTPPPPPAPTPAPTSAPTSGPAPITSPIVLQNYYRYGLPPLPPPPPPGWFAHAYIPTAELVPGSAWPALVGRNRDTVVGYLMQTYPRLTVRAVPFGSPVSYDARDTRITVRYDMHTRRVVDARIG